jgi:hypothetical protein
MKRRPSPSFVISLIALFVAMGGTGYAAVHLGKNTVGSRQIRAGAVGSSEVKNGALRPADFSGGALSALRGPAGAAGAAGAQGPTGPTGATGPSDAWAGDLSGGTRTFTLPPGSYVFSGGASATGSGTLTCYWNVNPPAEDQDSHIFLPGQSDAVPGAVSVPGAVTISGPSNFTATMTCSVTSGTIVGAGTATRVGTLH